MNSRIGAALYLGLAGCSGVAIGLTTGLKIGGEIAELAYVVMLAANMACVACLVVGTRADTTRCLRELDAWEERRLAELCAQRRPQVDEMIRRATAPENRVHAMLLDLQNGLKLKNGRRE